MSPPANWVRVYGGTGQNWISAVAADPSGNAVIAGHYDVSIDFGNGATLVNGGAFLAKIDAQGNHVWSKRFDTLWPPNKVGVDAAGNIYLLHTFEGGMVDFGGGAVGLPLSTAVLVTYDASGKFLRQALLGGAGKGMGNVGSAVLAVDPAGGAVVTGTDYSAGNTILDEFVERFDSTGNLLWTRSFQPSFWARFAGVDGQNTVLGGNYGPSADAGCGALPQPFNQYDSLALVRLDASGNCVFSQGGLGNAMFSVMAFSGGGFTVTGNLFKPFDFGGGTLQPGMMIASFDPSPKYVFGHSYPAAQGNLQTREQDIQVDAAGNFVVAGYYGGGACEAQTPNDPILCTLDSDCSSKKCFLPTLDFGLGKLPAALNPYEETFLVKYSPSGTPLASSAYLGRMVHPVLAPSGSNLYLAGDSYGPVDFGLGMMSGVGMENGVLVQLKE